MIDPWVIMAAETDSCHVYGSGNNKRAHGRHGKCIGQTQTVRCPEIPMTHLNTYTSLIIRIRLLGFYDTKLDAVAMLSQ